jgi:predicted dehydrogenase
LHEDRKVRLHAMRIAIVGTGFVADFYMESLSLYPHLELAAVTDRNAERLEKFTAHHRLSCGKQSLNDVLADDSIELVLNLTNPDSHYEVSKSCLERGKHVYSEKPLAMQMNQARELYELAESKGLRLASAPCNVLSETAQSMWKALREDVVGNVKLVYAEMDDGLVHKMRYRQWRSASGHFWPYKDEFEVGCTLEHAGYYVTWLTAFFGPAMSVTAYSSCLYPDKETDVPLDRNAPDFSTACIRFASGVVARLTCSIIAPRDQHFRFFGDHGILYVDDSWDYRAPVKIKRWFNVRRRTIISPFSTEYPLKRFSQFRNPTRKANPMEFCRGPAEIATAIAERRESYLPADFCLHNNEIVLAIQHATENSATYNLTTTFKSLRPMI